MSVKETPQVQRVAEVIPVEQLEVATRSLTISDAMRIGAQVTEHSKDGWGVGDNACALSAARIGAAATGWCE